MSYCEPLAMFQLLQQNPPFQEALHFHGNRNGGQTGILPLSGLQHHLDPFNPISEFPNPERHWIDAWEQILSENYEGEQGWQYNGVRETWN